MNYEIQTQTYCIMPLMQMFANKQTQTKIWLKELVSGSLLSKLLSTSAVCRRKKSQIRTIKSLQKCTARQALAKEKLFFCKLVIFLHWKAAEGGWHATKVKHFHLKSFKIGAPKMQIHRGNQGHMSTVITVIFSFSRCTCTDKSFAAVLASGQETVLPHYTRRGQDCHKSRQRVRTEGLQSLSYNCNNIS